MRVMFTAEQIARRVRELGLELARDYQDKRPLYVGVLKGACMFQCDLARATPIDLDLDFVSVSSYGAGKASSGNVRLLMDLREDVADRHVVLCEGVVDSGLSVSFLLDVLKRRRPASLVRRRLPWGMTLGRHRRYRLPLRRQSRALFRYRSSLWNLRSLIKLPARPV